jgi:predicted AAA+ superfamily ATPase
MSRIIENLFGKTISEEEFYSESRIKRVRREKKIFVNDIGIRNVSTSVLDDYVLTNSSEIGKIAQTVVGDHTRRLRFNLESTPFPPLFYWREKYEVDFVIHPWKKAIPIEVKYKARIDEKDLRGLKILNEEFNPPLSLVITKDHLSRRDSIMFIPVWLYLIMC